MLAGKTIAEMKEIAANWMDFIDNETLYGFGMVDTMSIHDFSLPDRLLRFEAIFDNDKGKQGLVIAGHNVLPPRANVNGKIIILSNASSAISHQLQSMGHKEFEDFIYIAELLALLNWFYYNRLYLHVVQDIITTRCTLKCNGCSASIPFYKHPADIKLDELKHDAALLFKNVDYVHDFRLFGGEPLLNKGIGAYMRYLIENFGDKMGILSVNTNMTILPDADFVAANKNFPVLVRASDYTPNNLNLKKSVDAFQAFIEEHNINCVIAKPSTWFQMHADKPLDCTDTEHTAHYRRCNTICKALRDGRIWNCQMAWNAMTSGFIPYDAAGSIALDGATKEEVFQHYYAFAGHMAFCKQCNVASGRGQAIPAAMQFPLAGEGEFFSS